MITVTCDKCNKNIGNDIWKVKALWTGLTMYYKNPEEFQLMGEYCEGCKKKIEEFCKHD